MKRAMRQRPPLGLRALLAGLVLATLAGCGFHLRGTASLPQETIYISGPAYSAFANDVKRFIRAGTSTRIVDDAQEADATVFILNETRVKTILSLTPQGTVREFQLRYVISFRVADRQAKELLPQTDIALVRSYIYTDAQVLASESEEALLYRDMQQDAAQQLLRRLSAPSLRRASTPPAT